MKESIPEEELNRVDPMVHLAAVGLVALPFGLMFRRHMWTSLKWMFAAWRRDPIFVLSRIITSFLVGQCIFWFAYDQISLGAFKPKFQPGWVPRVAGPLAHKVPDSFAWVWGIKAVEIATDAAKAPLEGLVFTRFGFVSDAVAFAATQPAWSLGEAADKLVGAVTQPEYVRTREGLQVSISCIIGSLFRFVLAGLGLILGKQVVRYIADPIERQLRQRLQRG